MKALLLAAGYARRLGELAKDTPKALLEISNKPLLDYLIEKLEKVNDLTDIYLITNEKYFKKFVEWRQNYKGRLNVFIKSDGTTSNENRLGAIGDIIFSIENFNIDDDLLITATDSYFNFELDGFIKLFKDVNLDVIMGQKFLDKEEIKRFGVAQLDKDNIIIDMEEKPQEPKSDIVVYATYIFKKDTLPLFYKYKNENNNMDAPGNFVNWLYKRSKVKVFIAQEKYYDIGTKETYSQLKNN